MLKPILLLTATLVFSPLMAMEEGDSEGTGWDNLPDELKLEIFSHLKRSDHPSTAGVSKEWKYLANEDAVWRSLAKKEGYQGEPKPGESWKEFYHKSQEFWKDLIKQSTKDNGLILADKDITYIPNRAFLLASKAFNIDLSKNPLGSLNPAMIDLKEQIISLHLQDTQLKELPRWLASFKNLKLLNITNTPIKAESIIAYLEDAPAGINIFLSREKLDEMKNLKDDSYKEIQELYEEANFRNTPDMVDLKRKQ